jgi:hypothetical protein
MAATQRQYFAIKPTSKDVSGTGCRTQEQNNTISILLSRSHQVTQHSRSKIAQTIVSRSHQVAQHSRSQVHAGTPHKTEDTICKRTISYQQKENSLTKCKKNNSEYFQDATFL